MALEQDDIGCLEALYDESTQMMSNLSSRLLQETGGRKSSGRHDGHIKIVSLSIPNNSSNIKSTTESLRGSAKYFLTNHS